MGAEEKAEAGSLTIPEFLRVSETSIHERKMIFQQIAKILTNHNVKFSQKEDYLEASYSKDGEKTYTVYIRQAEKRKVQMELVFATAVEKRFRVLTALYIVEKNSEMDCAEYKLDLVKGKLSLEYNFGVSPDIDCMEDDFWESYRFIVFIASQNLADIKGLAKGSIASSRKDYYGALITEAGYIHNDVRKDEAKQFLASLQKLDMMRKDAVSQTDQEPKNVLRYFADWS